MELSTYCLVDGLSATGAMVVIVQRSPIIYYGEYLAATDSASYVQRDIVFSLVDDLEETEPK